MKTYGKYFTQCGEREIDEFHVHELLDRLHIVRVMFSDFVADHPASILVQSDVMEITGRLMEFYQRVSKLRIDGVKDV